MPNDPQQRSRASGLTRKHSETAGLPAEASSRCLLGLMLHGGLTGNWKKERQKDSQYGGEQDGDPEPPPSKYARDLGFVLHIRVAQR